MKRAELIPGKAYFYSRSADWSESYRNYPNLCQTALHKKDSKVTIIRTYLETNYEKNRRQREVLVRDWRGAEVWVPLSHIRGTFKECVASVYHRNKAEDNRGTRHAQHLRRKQQREVHQPALDQMRALLNTITGQYLSDYTTVSALTTLQVQTLLAGLRALEESKAVA